jgi:hypothetical protein
MDKLLNGEDFRIAPPLLGIDEDGNAFFTCNAYGGDFFSAGNIGDRPIEEIVERSERDPLFMFMGGMPMMLVRLMKDAEENILDELRGEPNADMAVSRILESPARRLYLTKIIIQQLAVNGTIGNPFEPDFGVLPQMGLDVRPREIIEEYRRNREKELVA